MSPQTLSIALLTVLLRQNKEQWFAYIHTYISLFQDIKNKDKYTENAPKRGLSFKYK